jgi:hypothetical protein
LTKRLSTGKLAVVPLMIGDYVVIEIEGRFSYPARLVGGSDTGGWTVLLEDGSKQSGVAPSCLRRDDVRTAREEAKQSERMPAETVTVVLGQVRSAVAHASRLLRASTPPSRHHARRWPHPVNAPSPRRRSHRSFRTSTRQNCHRRASRLK